MNIENDMRNFDDIWVGKVDKKTMTLNVKIWDDFDKQVVFTKQKQ